MDLITYRAYVNKMLANEPKQIQNEVHKRIKVTLDILDTETMSIEGVAIIIALTKAEKDPV